MYASRTFTHRVFVTSCASLRNNNHAERDIPRHGVSCAPFLKLLGLFCQLFYTCPALAFNLAMKSFYFTHELIPTLRYCPNGELFDFIVSSGKLPEDEARKVFQQIVGGIEYAPNLHFPALFFAT